MKPSINVRGATTKVPSKRDEKKQINISWNSRIFFQVGLIISMLAMFFVLEMEIELTPNTAAVAKDRLWEELPLIDYTIEKEKIEKPKVKPERRPHRQPVKTTTTLVNEFEPIKDDVPIEEPIITPSDPPVVSDPTPVTPVGTTSEPETTTLLGVEFVPVFPGCERAVGNQAKVDCMSSKISKFISNKFDTGEFDYFEPGSIQTIYAMFTISATGNVVDIKARTADKKLEEEAIRVIQKLPEMQAGRQGNTPVNVTYSVPIRFQVSK